jgi:hypothetical protein
MLTQVCVFDLRMRVRRRWSVACSSSIVLSKDEVAELQGMGIQLTGPPGPGAAAAADEDEGDCSDLRKELFKD